jgi:hypothetical protein
MNRAEFVNHLRATAAAIKPLTESTPPGAKTWDGKQYSSATVKYADPYALSWWSTLSVIAALIEAQDCPVSEAQRSYLDRTLFGGMGSLNDLYFDPRALGALADTVNRSLDERRRELYAIFRNG